MRETRHFPVVESMATAGTPYRYARHDVTEKISSFYDEMIKDGFHGFAGKTEQFFSAVGAVSREIRIRRIVIFFAVKLKDTR